MKQERSDINDLINKNQKLESILISIIADVEAMRANRPWWAGDDQEAHWFGGFELGNHDSSSYSGTYIHWPNLSLLINEAKQHLGEKWTTNKKSETSGQPAKN